MDAIDRTFRRLVQVLRTSNPEYLSRPFELSELYQNIIPFRHHRRELGIDTNQEYELTLLRLLSGERGYVIADREMQDYLQGELGRSNPDGGAFRAYATSPVSLAPDAVQAVEQALRSGHTPMPPAPAAQPRPAPPAAPPPIPRPAPLPAPAAAAPPPNDPYTAPTAPMSMPPGFEPRVPRPSRSNGPGTTPTAAQPSVPAYESPRSAPAPAERAPAPVPRPPTPRAVPPVSPAAAPPVRPPDVVHVATGGQRAVEGGGSCRYCSGHLPDGRPITFCPYCGHNLTVRQCPACSTELELDWKFCTTCGRQVEGSS